MTQQNGKVYLVGAGPGDVAYLTVKAYNLLATAQVLVYDALVDEQLLQCVSPDCLKLDVGKRGGKPSTPQADINHLLVKYCQEGALVVRLKSGDPFIFGRCTSEIEALKAAGCKFEVVPGISSSIAAPLLAGIPLTDPVMSRCFAVLTAHEPEVLDWEALSRLDTLVILMGGKNLADIINELLRRGQSHLTPIAIIRWAGTPSQQIWTGQLGDILEQTRGLSLSPAVIVIGEVVGLRKYLQPEKIFPENSTTPMSSNQPLTGKTILVTRSSGQSSQFSDRLTTLGATVIEMPALEIGSPSSWEELDQAIANLSQFEWLILTSTNGVDYFFERLNLQGKDTRALAGVKIAVVGEKTSQSLKQRGIQADFIPPNFVADSLVEHFPESLLNKKILFPRVESGGREILVKELSAKGAEVIEVAAYQSCCPSSIPPAAELALKNHTIDIITFASSKTVQFFHQLVDNIFPHNIPNTLAGICIASIGPQTSKTCHTLLGRVDVEAEEYTLDGLTQSIINWALKV
ncbi:uroporphyrinogen-III synthase / uroporphyrinogen-III C-methyltransferase [Trichormus variabilis ATCC 29413]|uniref:uroporphyrinogen-III C-methyltransferase n=2 Tax=Anabaena variabilis TaxID=264691 RepID=Q3M7F5_TRIV2|nr:MULTISPECIES: uroporphyrinogen-III C-methyltransferase [Nostocaceae]ABA23081.1 uroporphyrinogen-III synthase / uroporphyrinogen-III C-methyltransferase [Trichormus variabilis ATCC 29413]MBC1216007.1 uroporphyrinogen-III C-methyltransferase [Trichormus variabilis ARAD]MBC1255354.1 uroporphyrinogen-III C-methyltransferase [Trichormus variabilis V5]MBC1265703.1 uroporphyrinogen-III C-methyltransferase [Trichormus variabilis FSR]MBC1303456.1 uroporphyrinogen-III C-methyltransferase [Trichormus 